MIPAARVRKKRRPCAVSLLLGDESDYRAEATSSACVTSTTNAWDRAIAFFVIRDQGRWDYSHRMHAIWDPAEAAKFAAAVIRRHLLDPAYRIFLFGSRATGAASERSDIDIGIEGPSPVSRAALALIHDELEEARTLYTIEVVDFARVSDKFRRVAERRIPL